MRMKVIGIQKKKRKIKRMRKYYEIDEKMEI
jgi:hypothetical protein